MLAGINGSWMMCQVVTRPGLMIVFKHKDLLMLSAAEVNQANCTSAQHLLRKINFMSCHWSPRDQALQSKWSDSHPRMGRWITSKNISVKFVFCC